MKELIKASLLVKLSILTLISCGFPFYAFAEQATSQGLAHHIAVCPGPAAVAYGRCHLRVLVDAKGKPFATNTAVSGYGPQQFQTAYGVTTPPSSVWSWNGQTIAIVDAYNGPYAESDLNTYSSTFGLPACTTANGCFEKVNQSGGTRYPRANQGWALEISLDVQIAHAMCPACKILLVEANSSSFANLLRAEDYATSHATVVSNSWGGNEFSTETNYDGHFQQSRIPITFSSGDSGYGVEYPGSSRYVNAVGGTTLTLNADNTRLSETAWSGSGSGCSAHEPKPNWQKDAGCGRRTVADVSADADPNTGAAVYDSYGYNGSRGWFQVGGTSLASPLIASIFAVAANTPAYAYGSYPYANATSLYDVVSGSDGSCRGSYLCTAEPGYDGPTGLGTPNGTSAF